MILRYAIWAFSAASMVMGAVGIYGQDYPNKPIRLITVGVGGATDLTARLVAQGISAPLGQTIIIDNRSVNPAGIAAKATPDGYTLLIAGGFQLDALMKDMGFDPAKDFSPIVALTRSPNLFVIHPSLPVNSVKELVAYAKSKPGVLNYGSSGSSGAGGASYIAMEQFMSRTGIKVVHIPYKSVGDLLNGTITNQVQMTIIGTGGTMPQVKSGKLKALAITTAEPSALAPGIPTMAASGLPGFKVAAIVGMYAPSKTPEAIVNRLNRETVRILNNPDIRQKFYDLSLDVAEGGSPQQLATELKAQVAEWSKAIKDFGIKAN